MLRIRFYNRRFASRAPAAKTPSLEAVIQPPAAPCLTARRRLRAEQRRTALSRGEGERRSFFGCLSRFAARNPLTPPGPTKKERVNAQFPLARLASLDSTSMPPLSRARGAFRRGSPGRAPSRAPAPEPCSRWPAGAGAAHFHRGSRTSTRPFSAPLSRCVSWPRALQRLLQIDVSTSTTMGRSSILAAIRGRDGRHCRSIVAFRSTATAEGSQGQGSRITEPRPSLPGLLPKETLPRPRLLQTPRVADIARRPVWSRRG